MFPDYRKINIFISEDIKSTWMRKDGKYTKLLGHAGSLKAITCFIKTAIWIRMEKYIILHVCMCKGEKKTTLHSSLSKDIVTLILTPNNFSWRLQLHYKAEVEKQIRFLFMMALPLHLKRPQRNHEKGIWTAHSFSSEAIFNLKKKLEQSLFLYITNKRILPVRAMSFPNSNPSLLLRYYPSVFL